MQNNMQHWCKTDHLNVNSCPRVSFVFGTPERNKIINSPFFHTTRAQLKLRLAIFHAIFPFYF